MERELTPQCASKGWWQSNANRAMLLLTVLPALFMFGYAFLLDGSAQGIFVGKWLTIALAAVAGAYAAARNLTVGDIRSGRWVVTVIQAAIVAAMAVLPVPPPAVPTMPEPPPGLPAPVEVAPPDVPLGGGLDVDLG
jgi:hypothetical protein